MNKGKIIGIIICSILTIGILALLICNWSGAFAEGILTPEVPSTSIWGWGTDVVFNPNLTRLYDFDDIYLQQAKIWGDDDTDYLSTVSLALSSDIQFQKGDSYANDKCVIKLYNYGELIADHTFIGKRIGTDPQFRLINYKLPVKFTDFSDYTNHEGYLEINLSIWVDMNFLHSSGITEDYNGFYCDESFFDFSDGKITANWHFQSVTNKYDSTANITITITDGYSADTSISGELGGANFVLNNDVSSQSNRRIKINDGELYYTPLSKIYSYGYTQGKGNEVPNDNYWEGYYNGYDAGKSDGIQIGLNQTLAESPPIATAKALFSAVMEVMDIKLFGYISLGSILGIIIIFGLVGLLFHLIRG